MSLRLALFLVLSACCSNLLGQVVSEVVWDGDLPGDQAVLTPIKQVSTSGAGLQKHENLFADKGQPANFDPGCHCGKSYCDLSSCCPPPCWEFQVDAAFLTRDASPLQSLATGVVPQWNVAEMEFNHQTGVRLSAARRINDWEQLEVNWLGLEPMTSVKTRNQFAQIIGPGYTYFSGGQHNFVYDSSLHSGEINIRRQMNGWRYLVGFRYMEISELFTATSNGNFAYGMSARNYMYGLQVGADSTIWQAQSHPLSVDANFKAGLLANQTNAGVLGANFVSGTAADRDWSAAIVVEAGLSSVLQLTDCLALRGGYQVMWVDNVGLASSLLAAPNTGMVTAIMNSNEDVVYHGGFVGLHATY